MLDAMISSAVDSSSATPMSESKPPPSMAKVQNFDEWVSNQQQKKLLRTKQLQHMMDQGSIITGRSMATNNTMLTDEMNEDQMALRRTQKHSLVHRNVYQQGSEPRKLLPQPLSRTKPPLGRPTYNVSTTASTASKVHKSSIVNSVRAQQSLNVDKHQDMMNTKDVSNEVDDEPIINEEVVTNDDEGMAIIKLVHNTIQERRSHIISKGSMSSTSTSTTISLSPSSSPPTSVSTSSTLPHSPDLSVESHIDNDSIFDFSIDQSKFCDNKVSTPKTEKKIQQQQMCMAQQSRMNVASSSSSRSSEMPHPSSPTDVAEFDLQSKRDHLMSGREEEHVYPMMPSVHEHDNESMQAYYEALALLNGKLNSLQNQYATLQSEHSALQRSRSEQVQQTTVLQDRNSSLTRQLTALNDSKEELLTRLEQSEDMQKAEVVKLNECNLAMRRELNELKREREDRIFEHNLELTAMDGERHNAMLAVDGLTKENQQLKCDITSLHDRVSCLEIEKDKVEADFNVEMTQHNKTKTELSAWKLEMLNAVNDIELLKKERNDLKAK